MRLIVSSSGGPCSVPFTRYRTALLLALTASLVMVSFPSALSAPWSEWRGDPQHTAPYDGGPLPMKGELIWSFQTGDQVLSSPVFYEGGMLIGSDDGWLYCMDPQRGSVNWKFRTDGSIQATALIIGDRAYFGSLDAEFYCISLPAPGSGAQPGLVWNQSVTDQIISSAHEHEGRLYFADLSGTVHCLTLEGKVVWSEKVSDREIWASPALDPSRGLLYIGDIGKGFYSLSMATGQLERSLTLTDRTEIYSSAALSDDHLFICTGEERELLCIGVDDLKVRWGFRCDDPCYSTPNVKDGRVFFSSYRFLWCVPDTDLDGDGNVTEDEIHWRVPIHGFQGGSSPLVTDDMVFVGSDDEFYRMFCLDPLTGEELWNVSAKGYVYSSPSLHNGSVYFGSSDRSIYCAGERPPGIDMELSMDRTEMLSNSTSRFDMVLTDGNGSAVQGAEVRFILSSGVISLDGREPYDGDLRTDEDGALTVFFIPPAVSSRSTIVVSLEASHPGLSSARTSFSLIVEPAEGDDRGGGFEYKDPDRPFYLAAFGALLLVDIVLFAMLTGLTMLFKKMRKEAMG